LVDRVRFNHGTLTNMDPATAWVASGGKLALDFDGVNDCVIRSPFNFPPTPNSSFTVSFWILWLSTQTDFRLPFSFGVDAAGGNKGYFIWRSNSGFVRAEFGSGTGQALSPAATANNVWTHCVGRYDLATNKLFLQGIEVASVNYTVANFNAGSILGLGGVAGTLYFTHCQMDDITIYNTALTPNEVREIYRLGRGYGVFPEPDFDEGFGAGGFKAFWARRQSQLIGGGV
jgi:hypothetical protein